MYGQILLDLQFLPLPDATLETISAELGVRRGCLPAHLFRGLEIDVPTFVYPDHVINTHAALSDEQAYAIVKAIDDHPDVLHEGYVAFSYNPRTAWQDLGIPLHPGAERFYREQGYLLE